MFIWILLIGKSNNDCELRNLSVYFQQLKIHRDIVSSYFWYPMKAWIYNFFFQKNLTFKNYTHLRNVKNTDMLQDNHTMGFHHLIWKHKILLLLFFFLRF